MDKLVRITDKGISIINDELMEKVKSKNLSPSMVSSFLECPADWLMNTFILKEIEHEETLHLIRGNLFHSVLEGLYALDKEERNLKSLGTIAMKTLKTERYSHLLNDGETKQWLQDGLKGYVKINPDFAEENIAVVNIEGKEQSGLELFVSAPIGNTKRRVLGFIDKVTADGDLLYIEDYKTGKKVSAFSPDKKISTSNDFGYWRQQLFYTEALRSMGLNVAGARLTFPVAGKIVDVDVNNKDMIAQMVSDFEELDKQLDLCIENNLFPFKGGMWCQWCGMLSPNFKAPRFPLKINKKELIQFVEY